MNTNISVGTAYISTKLISVKAQNLSSN